MIGCSSRHAVALALMLTASGCGGGGGGTGGGGGSIGAPPPISAPTPSPTPAPAPSPTYATLFDFSRDGSFDTQVADVRVSRRYNENAPSLYEFASAQATLYPDQRAATVDYRAGPQSLTIASGTQTSAFDAQTLRSQTLDGFRYARVEPSSSDSFLLLRPQAAFRYLAFSNQTLSFEGVPDNGRRVSVDVNRYFLIGVPTEVSDLPTSGISSYPALLDVRTVTFEGGGGGFGATGTLAFDFGTGQLSGSIVASQSGGASGAAPVRATLVLSGSALNGYIRGRVTSPDSGYAGDFVGRFYGPRGAELGLVFALSRDGIGSAGQLVALKS